MSKDFVYYFRLINEDSFSLFSINIYISFMTMRRSDFSFNYHVAYHLLDFPKANSN